MRAAFGAGVHIIELDILTSKDEQLEVFHGATLECPTNATGTAVAASADNIRESVGAGPAMNASRRPRPPPSGGRPSVA